MVKRIDTATLVIALAGMAVMLGLAFKLLLPPGGSFMMTRVYDLYLQALLEGRFDLPLRELRLEGHYTPNGTGYLYHGLGPLLTRLPFVFFTHLPTTWIAPLSIWFWAVCGNICYHRAFALALGKVPAIDGGMPPLAGRALAAMVWFGAPGLLLTANGALFIEPVAMAYALGGGIILLLARIIFAEAEISRALLPLAVLAGLTVHARPHLAVGYYAGILMLTAFAAWRGSRQVRLRGAVGVAVLGLFGLVLIASNAARFDTTKTMHGSFSKSELQYGWVYWGGESEDSERVQGFEKYGQFNLKRVAPNAMMYLAEPPPVGFLGDLRAPFEEVFRSAGPWVRHMRLEEPNVGMLFLWPLWLLLMLAGLRQRALWSLPASAGMASVAIGAGLMLSYATITMRYHVDLWPLVAFPALFGVAPVAAWANASSRMLRPKAYLLVLLLAGGVSMTALTVGGARNALLEADGLWTKEFCLKLTKAKGFNTTRGQQLCAEGLD